MNLHFNRDEPTFYKNYLLLHPNSVYPIGQVARTAYMGHYFYAICRNYNKLTATKWPHFFIA